MQEQRETQYLVISFSHKHMDLTLREKLAFGDEEKLTFLRKLCECEAIKEAIEDYRRRQKDKENK